MKKRTIAFLIVASMATCAICQFISASLTKSPPVRTPYSTRTPRPTDTPKPTKTVMPTPTMRKAGIPNLSPYDVIANLERRNMTCSTAKEINDPTLGTWFAWTCTRSEEFVNLQVEITSRTLSDVDVIDATILQTSDPSNDAAIYFFGFVATFAHIDNKELQNEAKSWVEQNLPNLSDGCIENIIEEVKFRLCGPPTARWIEIGEME